MGSSVTKKIFPFILLSSHKVFDLIYDSLGADINFIDTRGK